MCSRTTPDVHKLQAADAITISASTHSHSNFYPDTEITQNPARGYSSSAQLLLVGVNYRWRPPGQESIFPDLSMLKRSMFGKHTQIVFLARPGLFSQSGRAQGRPLVSVPGAQCTRGVPMPLPVALMKAPSQGSRQAEEGWGMPTP